MSLKSLYASLFNVYRRQDLTPWEHVPSSHPPIYGVYHVYCAPGWQLLVQEQIERLKASGLWTETTLLLVSCIVTSDSDVESLRSLMGEDSKWELISAERDKTKFEFPALTFLQHFSQNHEGFFYYFHTKGVSFMASANGSRSYLRFSHNVMAWRRMMEYFVFDQWRVAVNVLTEGYDTYGTLKIDPPYVAHSHYSGNFWWARSAYLASLPVLGTKTDRFSAEMWILSGNGKFFCAFDDKAILYNIYMPEQLYLPHQKAPGKKLRFVFDYNLDKFKRRVLKINGAKDSVQKYRGKT